MKFKLSSWQNKDIYINIFLFSIYMKSISNISNQIMFGLIWDFVLALLFN